MDNVESALKLEWETPVMETLEVEQTASNPGIGFDGGSFDCSLS
ncbi:MAG: hypothetical protein V4484_08195 [Pseudomonadota bacterium]